MLLWRSHRAKEGLSQWQVHKSLKLFIAVPQQLKHDENTWLQFLSSWNFSEYQNAEQVF